MNVMKFFKLIILTLSTLILTACESKNGEEIVVGTSADNPPYEFIQDGKIVGMDIDVINAISNYIGKKVVIKNLDFHGLMAALTSNNIDLAIAALSVTPARKARVDFSDTYTSVTIAVLYRSGDVYEKIDDLREKHVGAQLGSTWGQFAQEVSNKLHIKIHSLANNLLLVEELRSKKLDAVLLEEAQAKNFIANDSNLTYFLVEKASSNCAIAFPRNSLLKDSVNNAIKVLEDNGTFEQIRKKWLK